MLPWLGEQQIQQELQDEQSRLAARDGVNSVESKCFPSGLQGLNRYSPGL
jgi:hypothetical protein